MSQISLHKLGDKEYGLVTVPLHSHEHHLYGNGTGLCYWDNSGHYEYVELSAGKWELVGKGSEVTEEQWEGIVDKEYFEDDSEYYYIYEKDNKVRANLFYDTAVESGLSWLKSLNHDPDTTIILIKKP